MKPDPGAVGRDLGALLREAQQVGTDHCDALGVTTERLLGFGAAFVLVKVSVETYRDICARRCAASATGTNWRKPEQGAFGGNL